MECIIPAQKLGGQASHCTPKKQLKENNTVLTVEECQIFIDKCRGHLKPIVIIDLQHGFILLEVTRNGDRRQIPIDSTLIKMFNGMPRGFESKYVLNSLQKEIPVHILGLTSISLT